MALYGSYFKKLELTLKTNLIFTASAKTSAVAAEAMGTVIESFTQGTGFYRNPVAADFF